MGKSSKVQKLRKKYKVFCTKNASMTLNENNQSEIPILRQIRNQVNNIRDPKSTCETKNELCTEKKAGQRSRCQKSEICANLIRSGNGFRNTANVSQLSDNLPVFNKYSRPKTNLSGKIKSKTKHSQPRKLLRQNNLIQSIIMFQKTLNDESFRKNPRIAVMNQTLERLSAESSC